MISRSHDELTEMLHVTERRISSLRNDLNNALMAKQSLEALLSTRSHDARESSSISN